MAKDLVNNLYKFLKEDVTETQLFEADKKIKIPDSTVFAIEGRVPTDPSVDPNSEEYMGALKEKEKDAKGEVSPAKETEENKETKLEKDLEKDTPELEDNKALEDQETQGAEQKEVEKKKTEGRVPKDPSSDNPENKKDLKEDAPREKELTTMSDEQAAKELASKYTGGRVIPDAQGNQFIVMVPESTELRENDDEEVKDEAEEAPIEKDEAPEVDAAPKEDTAPEAEAQPKEEAGGSSSSAVPDLTPDAKGKVGSPTQSPADGQQVPKDSVDDDIELPGVDTLAVKEDAKAQAGSPGKKSVDKQSVPKTDVSLDNKTTGVNTATAKDSDLNPDAKKKVGTPKASPKQGQQIKTAADQGAKIDDVKKAPMKEEVAVSVSTDDKDITVTSDEMGTTVTTTDIADQGMEIPMDIPAEDSLEEIPTEEPVIDEIPDEDGEEIIMSDESIQDMAERMLLTGHLKKKIKLTDKEKEFLVATESVKLSEKNRKLVDEKLKALMNQ